MLQSRSTARCAGKFSGRHLAEFRLAETVGHYKFPNPADKNTQNEETV